RTHSIQLLQEQCEEQKQLLQKQQEQKQLQSQLQEEIDKKINEWDDAMYEVQVEQGVIKEGEGDKLTQHKQKQYQPRSSDSYNCDGVRETSFVLAQSGANSVESYGTCDERVEKGSVKLNYRAPEFRLRATSGEVTNYPRDPIKKKPQEFDEKVSWEAYQAQFELLAEQNGWDDKQCAVQLATSFKGAAMEVLSQLTGEGRCSYMSLKGGVEPGAKMRFTGPDSALVPVIEAKQQFTQDLENMAQRTYPGASHDLSAVMLRDQFVDALDSTQLKIQHKVSVGDRHSLGADFCEAGVVSHRQLPETSHQLCWITGHGAVLKGRVDISINLGGEEETLQVYIADIEDLCILGLDYLLPRKLKIIGKWVLLKTEKHASAKVTARRAVVIPPRSEALLTCKVNGALHTRLGLVEPD
ncbi:hypothetical protein Hamer_G029655, partial [Homarus americanus]